jgi:hypothetical protein
LLVTRYDHPLGIGSIRLFRSLGLVGVVILFGIENPEHERLDEGGVFGRVFAGRCRFLGRTATACYEKG